MSECHWCEEDTSDLPRIVNFGEFRFCGVCAYSIKELEELRCEECEEVITYICLIDEDAVGDGEGRFWCNVCRDMSSESDSEGDDDDDEEGVQGGPPLTLQAWPQTFQPQQVDAVAARARNLRDIKRLRDALPEFCSHHALYICTTTYLARCLAGAPARWTPWAAAWPVASHARTSGQRGCWKSAWRPWAQLD